MTKATQKVKVSNDRTSFSTLWLEPWGEDYGMHPNDELKVVAVEAEEKFCFHVYYDENDIKVWAEGDAKYVAVYQNDKMLSCGHNRPSNLTHNENIRCAMCDKLLAEYDASTDKHIPSVEALFENGAVPVPNFGWFCSQECGRLFTEKKGTTFDRDAEGNIRYY